MVRPSRCCPLVVRWRSSSQCVSSDARCAPTAGAIPHCSAPPIHRGRAQGDGGNTLRTKAIGPPRFVTGSARSPANSRRPECSTRCRAVPPTSSPATPEATSRLRGRTGERQRSSTKSPTASSPAPNPTTASSPPRRGTCAGSRPERRRHGPLPLSTTPGRRCGEHPHRTALAHRTLDCHGADRDHSHRGHRSVLHRPTPRWPDGSGIDQR